MASYNELNALIDAYINRNGVQAITGQILNGVLKAMVEQLGRGYTIMGAAIPTTDPGTPDGPECYFASETGTYTDFDGLQVVPGELALLCYTPTDGWTKATIYEGFREVGATIDGNVGTPSVGVSYANGVLSFDFHNMKGNTGAAAGFGNVTAAVDGTSGTPGVSVQTDGPATAKNIAFQFTGLKGETGVTSVIATVDNTSGTPQCAVSLNGQQLTLAFSGLKGAQGDTGSSVDYPFTIVNNLTTDDATQALSAAQGVVLDGKVTQLEAEVNGYDVPDEDVTPTFTTGYFYSHSGSTVTVTSNAGSKYSGTIENNAPTSGLDVSGHIGKTIKITMSGKGGSSSRLTLFAKSDMTYISGVEERSYDENYSKELVVPADAKWLLWSATYNLVSIVVKGSGHIDGLKDRVEDSEADVALLKTSVDGISEKTDLIEKKQSANLFDKNDPDVLIGRYITGNTVYDNAAYNASGYIPVSASTTYYCASDGGTFRFAEYYDASKAYISGGDFSEGTQFTTPATCAFVRVTFYAAQYATAQVAASSVPYSPYNIFLELTSSGNTDKSIATLKDIANNSGNVLFGKKWVACGDSFTEGDFYDSLTDNYIIESGKYAGRKKVYPFLIGNRNNMVIVNEAKSGSTMTYINGSRYEFSTPNGRYTQIPADADYITLKFGINDDTAHASAPIGTIDDSTNETFYGAWNVVLDYIITNHPQAKVGIIVTNGSQLPYVEATIAIAKKWGISYLNEATDEQCSFMFRSNRNDVVQSIRSLRNTHWFVNPATNSHPNELAHEYESTVVEAWLRTL